MRPAYPDYGSKNDAIGIFHASSIKQGLYYLRFACASSTSNAPPEFAARTSISQGLAQSTHTSGEFSCLKPAMRITNARQEGLCGKFMPSLDLSSTSAH